MRTKVLLLALFAFTVSISAQKLNVPRKVKDAFVKLYPNVKSVKWSMENKNEYEAEFKNNGRAISVNIDKAGKLIETEVDITKSELPKSAEEYVQKNFKGWQVTETSTVTNAKGVLTYEVGVKKAKTRKDLVFDKSGNFKESE